MRKALLLVLTVNFALVATAQEEKNCYEAWRDFFKKRGAYAVADDMHRNVIISYIEGEDAYCYEGKARVEEGRITSVFTKLEDGSFELMETKFYNAKKQKPAIIEGISELIVTEEGEKFYIIFKEVAKPKKKAYVQADGPPGS